MKIKIGLPKKKRVAIGGALLICIVAVGLSAGAARFLVVDSPRRAELIVVLAGETDHRPALALDLLAQGYGRRVILDVPAAARIYHLTQVELAEQYILTLAQAQSVSICPILGLSTRDEARDAAKCLASVPGDRVLIVTSDFHTRRALAIFRHELRGKSFSVAAARDDTQFGNRWWTRRQWAKTTVEEWMRLLWWWAVDRWR